MLSILKQIRTTSLRVLSANQFQLPYLTFSSQTMAFGQFLQVQISARSMQKVSKNSIETGWLSMESKQSKPCVQKNNLKSNRLLRMQTNPGYQHQARSREITPETNTNKELLHLLDRLLREQPHPNHSTNNQKLLVMLMDSQATGLAQPHLFPALFQSTKSELKIKIVCT